MLTHLEPSFVAPKRVVVIGAAGFVGGGTDTSDTVSS